MKILLISVYSHQGVEEPPVRLASVSELSSFNFFTRGTVGEHLKFASSTICQRTTVGRRQTVGLKDNPFMCCSYVRRDGLSGVCVIDKEYPERVAFTLLNKTLMDYEQAHKGWEEQKENGTEEPQVMLDDIVKFQDPNEADKLSKIQKNLDDIKDIMHKNIDEVLKRGETLDSLMDKSEDLSMTSKQFYKKAKKTNACCKY